MNLKNCLIVSAIINSVIGTINIDTNTTSTDVTYGSSVRLTCTISSITSTAFSWILRGTTQTNCRTDTGKCLPKDMESGRIQFSSNTASREFYNDISNTQSSDAGTYTCRHGRSSEQVYEETTITISVVSPIESVTMNSSTTDTVTLVQNTDTPEFVCVTSAGLPQPSISWYLENPSQPGDDLDVTSSASTPTTTTGSKGLITTTRRLTYRPSKTYNGWRVYCTASNTAGSTHTSSRKPMLNVQFPPTVQLTTPHKVIEGTSTLSIPCTITAGNPTATTYRWTRDRDNWSQTTSNMTLSNIQARDAAVYTCTATNTVGPDGSGTYTLDVLFPPRTSIFRYRSSTVTGTFKFVKNNAYSLSCASSSNPPPTYTWQGPGGTTNTASLALSGIQNNQGGVYTCTATNVMTPTVGNTQSVTRTNSAQITLDVLYALSQPILKYRNTTGSAITGTINVVKGDPVHIACVATGKPSPSYTWTNQSRSGQILTISSIQSDILPRCTASSRMDPDHEAAVDQSKTASVTVNVMYGPSVPVIRCIHCSPDIVLDSSVNIINGRSIHITCGESVSDPTSTYSWSGGLTSTTGILSNNSVSKTQDGYLTCTATNTMPRTFGDVQQGLNNKVVSLNILFKPTVGNMGNEDIVELTAFSKTCPVTSGNPTQTTYRWTRSTGGGLSQTTQTLTIPQVQREDTAVYTCTAQNIMRPTGRTQVTGQDSNTFTLTTIYKPDVVVTTTNTTESAVSAEIRCVATGVPDVYTYQPWKQTWTDGTVITHEGGLGNVPTLRWSDLTYAHSGIYTCMVDNGVSGSRNPDAGQGNVYFVVKSKPVITSPAYNSGDNYKLSIGLKDPSSINLTYYSNAGDTTVTVENGGQVVVAGTPTSTNVQLKVFTQTVSASGMTVKLDVNIQHQNQLGRYEIVLRNAVNSVKFSLVVAPKQPPEVPTQLTSSKVTETTAELTWIRGFHGGSDQTFVVQLSQDNINWNNKTFILDGQNDSNTTVNATLDSLTPGTTYHVRLFAFNQEGRKQDFSNVQDFTTKAVPVVPPPSSPAALIGGSAGGVILLVIIAVAVVVVLRRRKKSVKGASKENGRNNGDEIPEDDDDGMRENPMYDTSGSASNNDVYAQVNKPKKKEEPSKDIYAMVDKSNKKNQGNEDASLLYSMPVKKKGNKKEAKKEEKKKKDQAKSKQDKKAMGDIYENAPEGALAAAKPEENVYDSAEVPQPMPAPKRNVNQDGLLYAELDLPTNPGSQKSPPVIHGLDDMTEYSEVDFTKKAEPLPDSDEEDANAKK